MEELKLGIGDEIEVYKANMIIPQIARNLTESGVKDIPAACPVCGEPTEIRKVSNAKALYCTNPSCQAKQIKSYALFVGRDALNIDGLSEATLEKLIARGFIHDVADLFHLDRYSEEIQSMEGFGEKSYQNLMGSIEKARETTLPRLLYGLGIANIGLANAKLICKQIGYDTEKLMNLTMEELDAIDGVGEVIAGNYVDYFSDEVHRELYQRLLAEVSLPEAEGVSEPQILEGKNFVITGSVHHFSNRSEVKALIEAKGGKVTGSVTSKTDYLINNNAESSSSKNKKAKELGIPIISEEEFLALIQ